MKITIIQSRIHWEDPQANRAHFESLIEKCGETELIVLPEMFTTGFTMQPEKIAEAGGKQSLEWMKTMAKRKNCCITGSVAVKAGKKFFNRLFFVFPDGKASTYDKRHLFRMANEHEHYTGGKKKTLVKVGEYKIMPLVCYDLRFPVWSRNVFTKSKDKSQKSKGPGTWQYDILIYVANWPAARSHPWKQLLIARAIENQCFVVGVNRIGDDGNGVGHSGDSLVADAKGLVISRTRSGEESVETVNLDMEELKRFRTAFPAGMDADAFKLKV